MTDELTRKTAVALKALDDAGTGVAVIATLGVVDHDGDVIAPHAFDYGGPQTVPMLGFHRWDRPPAGKTVISEAGNEALAHFRLNLRSEGGRAIYDYLKFDYEHQPSRAEFSFGFTVPPGGAETRTLEGGQRVRLLNRLQVHEVSVVIKGAGIGTRLVTLKADDLADLDLLLARIEARIPTAPPEVLPAALLLAQRARSVMQGLLVDDLAEVAKAHCYRFVTLPVQDRRRQAAVAALKDASYELHASEPALRFFTEAIPGSLGDFGSDAPLWGATFSPNTVAILAGLSPADLRETVAHEVFHAARPGASEKLADLFAATFVKNAAASRLADYLARAAIFTELGRQRGWSGRELETVLAQL